MQQQQSPIYCGWTTETDKENGSWRDKYCTLNNRKTDKKTHPSKETNHVLIDIGK